MGKATRACEVVDEKRGQKNAGGMIGAEGEWRTVGRVVHRVGPKFVRNSGEGRRRLVDEGHDSVDKVCA